MKRIDIFALAVVLTLVDTVAVSAAAAGHFSAIVVCGICGFCLGVLASVAAAGDKR